MAGLASALFCNPIEVVRNATFKHRKDPYRTIISNLRNEMVKHRQADGTIILKTQGWRFLWRGLLKNMFSTATPIALTLYFTDRIERVWSDPLSRAKHGRGPG